MSTQPDHDTTAATAAAQGSDVPAIGWSVATAQGNQTQVLHAGPAFMCASLLKPLYVWVATRAADLTDDENAAITASDNDATSRIVAGAGGLDSCLTRIADHTGVHWAPAATWGRVHVTAPEVAAAYAALAASHDPRATAVLAAMRRVRPAQRLNVDAAWTPARPGTHPLPVKAGWDLHGRLLTTHVVLIDGDHATAALTGVTVNDPTAHRWHTLLRTRGDEAVLNIHRRHAGALLTTAVRDAASHAD